VKCERKDGEKLFKKIDHILGSGDVRLNYEKSDDEEKDEEVESTKGEQYLIK
jgi:hypothetical protein